MENGDGNKQQPQIDDAKNFLEKVKDAFKDRSGVYERFVEIMKNFKHDRLNTGGVIKEVETLFGSHKELFIGFQNFLPNSGLLDETEAKAFRMSMDKAAKRNAQIEAEKNVGRVIREGNRMDNSNPPDFNMAVTFICKIKQRFGAHRRIYNEFLSILQHFQTAAQANDTSVIRDVKSRIRELFKDHGDLLDQFDYFLPPLTAHFRAQAPNEDDDDDDVLNGNSASNSRRSGGVGAGSASTSSRKRTRSSNANNNNNNNSLENPHGLKRQTLNNRESNNMTNPSTQSQTAKSNKKSTRSNKKRKKRESDEDSDWVMDSKDTHAHSHSHTHGTSSHNNTHNNNNNNNTNNTTHNRIKTRSQKNESKNKMKLKRPSHHHRHRRSAHNKNTDYDDDIDSFSSSRSDDDITNENDKDNGNNNNNSNDMHSGLRIFSRLRKDIPDSLYKHILTLTQLYPMGLTEFSVVGKLICDALREHGYNQYVSEFEKELSCSTSSWFFRSRGQNYYEYLTSNHLLSQCKSCQASYRELPKDVVQPRCSGRHPDAAKVLNDYFVSKPTGSEGPESHGGGGGNTGGGRGGVSGAGDHGNDRKLKNQYGEELTKCADDLFELDMMICTNNAARIGLEKLYKSVMDNDSGNGGGHHRGHRNGGGGSSGINNGNHNRMDVLTQVEKRAISRLYSEHGNKVLTLLKKMPETTIPVVLRRLRQKSNEWQSIKNDMKNSWRSVSKKNYYKAHDYRYTIFKECDKKRILQKNLIKEIENIQKNGRLNLNKILKKGEHALDPFGCDDIAKSAAVINLCGTQSNNAFLSNGGVVSGVGLQTNQPMSQDEIIQKMGAGLDVECGNLDTKDIGLDCVDNNHLRFEMGNEMILKDCAKFIIQFANNQLPKNQKKIFSQILSSFYRIFFDLDITEQCQEFDRNDGSDDDDEDEDDDEDGLDKSIVSVLVGKLGLNEEELTEINGIEIMNKSDGNDNNKSDVLEKYCESYYKENVSFDDSVVLYGHKTVYCLFRYFHFLYARMKYAHYLCESLPLLYNKKESESSSTKTYGEFLTVLSNYINSHIDEELFENECRRLLGIYAYQVFTIDKVIENVYKKLCDLDNENICHEYFKLCGHFNRLFVVDNDESNKNNNKNVVEGNDNTNDGNDKELSDGNDKKNDGNNDKNDGEKKERSSKEDYQKFYIRSCNITAQNHLLYRIEYFKSKHILCIHSVDRYTIKHEQE